MDFAEKIMRIQREMKAPKNLFNKFGGYKYRNAEGILEAFKPFEEKYKVFLVICDEIVTIGERVYVKATATLYDGENQGDSWMSTCISNSAFAREDLEKKGMDGAQITGTASSYARKYALNGLFLLDDTKDADTDEYAIEKVAKAAKDERGGLLTVEQKTAITAELNRTGIRRASFLESYGVGSIDELTEKNAEEGLKRLKSKPDRK